MKQERLMVSGRVQICALFSHDERRVWCSLFARNPEGRADLMNLTWTPKDGEGLPRGTPMAMKDAIRWVQFLTKKTAAEAITIEKESA